MEQKKSVGARVGQGLRFAFLPNIRGSVNTDGIRAGGELISESVGSMRSRCNKQYRVETFAEAVERLDLTESDIKRKRHELLIEARIAYVMTAICLMIAIYNTAAGASALVVLGCLCCLVFPAVLSVTKSFRIDQIDRRELYSFAEFFRRPEAWLK